MFKFVNVVANTLTSCSGWRCSNLHLSSPLDSLILRINQVLTIFLKPKCHLTSKMVVWTILTLRIFFRLNYDAFCHVSLCHEVNQSVSFIIYFPTSKNIILHILVCAAKKHTESYFKHSELHKLFCFIAGEYFYTKTFLCSDAWIARWSPLFLSDQFKDNLVVISWAL